MLLYTGSVVVPETGETKAMFCPQRALMRVDLPTLHRPNNAMWGRTERGALFIGSPRLAQGATLALPYLTADASDSAAKAPAAMLEGVIYTAFVFV